MNFSGGALASLRNVSAVVCLVFSGACATTKPAAPRPVFVESDAFTGIGGRAVAHIESAGSADEAPTAWHALVENTDEGPVAHLFAPHAQKPTYQRLCSSPAMTGARLHLLHFFPTRPFPAFLWALDFSSPDVRHLEVQVLSLPKKVGAPCEVGLTETVRGPTDADNAIPVQAWGWVREWHDESQRGERDSPAGIEIARVERTMRLSGELGAISVPTARRRLRFRVVDVGSRQGDAGGQADTVREQRSDVLGESPPLGSGARRLHVDESLEPVFLAVTADAAWAFESIAAPSRAGGDGDGPSLTRGSGVDEAGDAWDVEPWPDEVDFVLRAGATGALKFGPRAASPDQGQANNSIFDTPIVAVEWQVGCTGDLGGLEVGLDRTSGGPSGLQRFAHPVGRGSWVSAIGVARNTAATTADKAEGGITTSRHLWLLREPLRSPTLRLHERQGSSSAKACLRGLRLWLWNEPGGELPAVAP